MYNEILYTSDNSPCAGHVCANNGNCVEVNGRAKCRYVLSSFSYSSPFFQWNLSFWLLFFWGGRGGGESVVMSKGAHWTSAFGFVVPCSIFLFTCVLSDSTYSLVNDSSVMFFLWNPTMDGWCRSHLTVASNLHIPYLQYMHFDWCFPRCPVPYSGEHCEHNRCRSRCQHNGTCTYESSGMFHCDCTPRWKGSFCNEDRCRNYCSGHGECYENGDTLACRWVL